MTAHSWTETEKHDVEASAPERNVPESRDANSDNDNANDNDNDNGEEKDAPEPLSRIDTSQSDVGHPKELWKEVIFVALVCMAQFMTQVGLGMGIVPAHIIGTSFGVASDPGELSWFAASYSLTVGTFILISGRMGDMWGHRRMFVIGFLWFALWSLLAGFSVWSNRVFFDCCRALQGIGPAMLLPNGVAIFGRTYRPGLRKAMAFSLFGATAPGGFITGAAFSSIFAQLVWWPWGYWVMAMACLVFAGLGLLIIPHIPVPRTEDDHLSAFERLDVLGSITGVIGLVLINFSWNQAPLVGWKEPYVYAILIVGFAAIFVFTFVERSAKCPLLPRSIFTGDLAWVLSCVVAGWSSMGIVVYYFYQLMLVIKSDTPLLATAKFSGASVSGAVASVTTGILLGLVRPSVIMFCSMSAFTIGICLVATLPVNQIYWAQAFLSSIITPWGMDMSFPSATLILSDAMPKKHQGLAGSLVSTTVNYSISIGLGFAGTVESHVNNGGKDILKGYRGALYMGVGLAASGVVISSAYVLMSIIRDRKGKKAPAT